MKFPADINTLNGWDKVAFSANAMKYILSEVAPKWQENYDITE